MHIEARFYETYEMCDIIDKIIRNSSEHLVGLEGFHSDGAWTWLVDSYSKYSALHKFIEYVVRDIHSEQAESFDLIKSQRIAQNFESMPAAIFDLQPEKLPIEFAFDHYGISYQSFSENLAEEKRSFLEATDDDVYHHLEDIWLSESYEKLLGPVNAIEAPRQ